MGMGMMGGGGVGAGGQPNLMQQMQAGMAVVSA